MIDARNARGVPCITTCPVSVPMVLITDGPELLEWQRLLLNGYGFLVSETPTQKPPVTR